MPAVVVERAARVVERYRPAGTDDGLPRPRAPHRDAGLAANPADAVCPGGKGHDLTDRASGDCGVDLRDGVRRRHGHVNGRPRRYPAGDAAVGRPVVCSFRRDAIHYDLVSPSMSVVKLSGADSPLVSVPAPISAEPTTRWKSSLPAVTFVNVSVLYATEMAQFVAVSPVPVSSAEASSEAQFVFASVPPSR